jgi:hypothetical protein
LSILGNERKFYIPSTEALENVSKQGCPFDLTFMRRHDCHIWIIIVIVTVGDPVLWWLSRHKLLVEVRGSNRNRNQVFDRDLGMKEPTKRIAEMTE